MRSIAAGGTLRIQAAAPFRLHWTCNEWRHVEDTDSTPIGTEHEYVDVRVPSGQRAPVRFTFFWTSAGRWEGRDFQVSHRAGSIMRTLAMIQLKRVYRNLQGRTACACWSIGCGRGLTKARAAVDLWLKDVAPSTELRQWFGHDPAKWKEFQVRYRKELNEKKDSLKELKQKSKSHTVTLLYGTRDEEHNEALVLKKTPRWPETLMPERWSHVWQFSFLA